MNKVIFKDLGRIDYQQAWDYQQSLLDLSVATKLHNRKFPYDPKPVRHYLLFCEHPPVYTLGKSGSKDNLLLDEQKLREQGFSFYKINRGGDITYHGPGQIVAYPIFDLDHFFTDVHKYVRFLEEAVIRTLAEYGIKGVREKQYTGVWLEAEGWKPMRKICAIGVHLSRWVTMHGLAFNINTQLDHFGNIIPCGIADANKGVTSLATELGDQQDIASVKDKLRHHFQELFEFELIDENILINEK